MLLVIPTLLGAAALVFVLMRLVPGDVCVVRLGSSGGTFDPEAIALCHSELGMDRPVVVQFIDFVWGAMRLDFGTSMWSGTPVTTEIWARLPISLEIAILATVVAIAIAIPLGALSALKQNTWIDVLVRVFAVGGIAMPSFWLGIVSLLVVLNVTSAVLGRPWMPPVEYVPIWQDPDPQPQHGVPAGCHGRIPLCRGQHAHDAIGDAGGDAGGLHPHRARQGADP